MDSGDLMPALTGEMSGYFGTNKKPCSEPGRSCHGFVRGLMFVGWLGYTVTQIRQASVGLDIFRTSLGVQSKIKHRVSMVFTVMLLFFLKASRVPVENLCSRVSLYCEMPLFLIVSQNGV